VLRIPTLSVALAGFALALAPACQILFGDYTVDTKGLQSRVCRVDEYQCAGELLQVCAESRSHWETFAACASADQCNLGSDSCRPCQAGVERQCSGATLLACNANAQWEKVKDCASAALCSATAGDCKPPVCPTPGKHQCTATGALERCSADQARWESVAACASVAECDAAQADAQVAAGQPASCTVTCTPGSEPCASPTCTTPGTFRCLSDLFIERCSETFQWTKLDLCKTFALCNPVDGRCDPDQCQLKQRRCTGNTVEECKGDLTGWAALRTCAADQLCDPSAPEGAECVPGPCAMGQTRCNSIFVEQCNGTSWERSKRCSGPCDPATKTCPATP
jgi:hypothetical protein